MSARRHALAVLRRWETGDERLHIDTLVEGAAARARLTRPDRAQLTALVYGVVRNRLLLDAWLGELLDRRPPDRLKPDLRTLLHLALFDLHLLGTAPHAAVNEAVALAPSRLRGLANAVLRRAARDGQAFREFAARCPLEVRTSHPGFLVERWRGRLGEPAAEALLEWDNRPPDVYVRANDLPPGRLPSELAGRLGSQVAVPWAEGTGLRFFLPPEFDPAWPQAGAVYVQDPSTSLAPCLLAPRPGERVLDACAAPGGKTGILAQLMADRGELVATDPSAKRLAQLAGNLDRLGVACARVLRHDWTSPAPDGTGEFDAVLLDVPCSNTGVLRRRADARWRLTPETFSEMATLQLAIARNAATHLRPGGRLVYSTCSLEPEENEGVIEALVRDCPVPLEAGEARACDPLRDGFDGVFAAVLTRRAR
jgi:16S rRNA (cytosine967-C5)-methyltransferase